MNHFVLSSTRHKWFVTVFVLIVLTSLFASCSRQHEFNGIVYNPPLVAPAIDGIDQTGAPFTLNNLKNNIILLFFGYTNCPDVCPLTMGQLTTIVRQLGDDADDVRVVLVSTDPERDSPQVLANYVKMFDSSFWGIQVPQAKLAEVMKAYGGLAEKDPIPEGKSADQYTVTHSNWIYAIDRNGDLRLIFSSQLQTQQIVDDIKYLLNE